MAGDGMVRITRVTKRRECYYVEGVVRVRGDWRKASFVAHAPDVEPMTREDFEAFAIRSLPDVIEGEPVTT